MSSTVVPPPPGVKPLQINNKQMEKYELKTGPSRKDTVAFKLFQKAEMLEEAIRLGFYSAWNDIRKEVEAYPGTEMVVVADVDEIYGENWWIAITEEAKERFFYVRLAAPGCSAGAAAHLHSPSPPPSPAPPLNTSPPPQRSCVCCRSKARRSALRTLRLPRLRRRGRRLQRRRLRWSALW